MEPFPLVSHGARLKAYLIPPRARPLVVFCHGFPGRHFNEPLARALAALGYGALLFRYRGAHGSEGAYAFHQNEEDILVAVEAARPHATHGLALLGYSMGGFHATRVLARAPALADMLVLQAPLADTRMLRERVGDLAFESSLASGHDVLRADPAALVAEARAFPAEEEPARVAQCITVPAIVLHGAHDEEVPPEQGRAVHDALAGPKRYVEVPDADHYFLGHERGMAKMIDEFAREHLAGARVARRH